MRFKHFAGSPATNYTSTNRKYFHRDSLSRENIQMLSIIDNNNIIKIT